MYKCWDVFQHKYASFYVSMGKCVCVNVDVKQFVKKYVHIYMYM